MVFLKDELLRLSVHLLFWFLEKACCFDPSGKRDRGVALDGREALALRFHGRERERRRGAAGGLSQRHSEAALRAGLRAGARSSMPPSGRFYSFYSFFLTL